MLAAGVFEWAQHQGSAAAVLQMTRQVFPSHTAHTTLIGAGHRQPWALVLMTLGPETMVNSLTPYHLPHIPLLMKGLTWIVSKTNSLVQ